MKAPWTNRYKKKVKIHFWSVVKVLLCFGCASRNSNLERTLFYVDTGQESLKNSCVRENMQSRQKITKNYEGKQIHEDCTENIRMNCRNAVCDKNKAFTYLARNLNWSWLSCHVKIFKFLNQCFARLRCWKKCLRFTKPTCWINCYFAGDTFLKPKSCKTLI